jgi:hypothetical protein
MAKVVESLDERPVPWIAMISPGDTGPPARLAPLMMEVSTGALLELLFGKRLITPEAEICAPPERSNVAVIVTLWGSEIVVGAVYNPVGDIVPGPPLLDQDTVVSDVPVTVAVKGKACEGARVALEGLRRRLMLLESDNRAMVALPDFEGSARLVAVTVTDCVELAVAGAVYSPLDRLPTEGVMDQVTALLELPVTLALNCRLCVGASVAFEGSRLTLTPAGVSWTTALADLEESATLVAVIVTD